MQTFESAKSSVHIGSLVSRIPGSPGSLCHLLKVLCSYCVTQLGVRDRCFCPCHSEWILN